MHFLLIFSLAVLQLLISAATPATGYNSELDPISSECMTCHNGSDAWHIRFCLPEQMGKGCGGHIVSVFYAEIVSRDQKKLRPVSSLPPELVLFEGKITCCTCHGTDPHLNGKLVIDNRQSALCRSCHIK